MVRPLWQYRPLWHYCPLWRCRPLWHYCANGVTLWMTGAVDLCLACIYRLYIQGTVHSRPAWPLTRATWTSATLWAWVHLKMGTWRVAPKPMKSTATTRCVCVRVCVCAACLFLRKGGSKLHICTRAGVCACVRVCVCVCVHVHACKCYRVRTFMRKNRWLTSLYQCGKWFHCMHIFSFLLICY